MVYIRSGIWFTHVGGLAEIDDGQVIDPKAHGPTAVDSRRSAARPSRSPVCFDGRLDAGTHARETNARLAQRQFGRCACEAPLARRSVRPAGAVPAEVPVVPKLPDRRRNVALAGAAESAVKAIGRDDRTTSDARGVSAYPRRPGASSSRPQSLFRELVMAQLGPRHFSSALAVLAPSPFPVSLSKHPSLPCLPIPRTPSTSRAHGEIPGPHS